MNGYFKLESNDMGTFLKLYAPTDGGSSVGIKELSGYLEREKIPYDLKELNNELTSMEGDKSIFLADMKLLPVAESCRVILTPDRMKAVVRFYPPSDEGKLYRREDIFAELKLAGVTTGIDEAEIDSFMEEKKYCTDYLLACGQPPREGSDAKITYHFETDNKIRPTLREDGSVDFFNLNVVNHCKAGDVLAVLTPEDKGDDGYDVLGNIIKPHDVKRATLQYGLNIDINEDRTVLTSQVNGHVSLVDGKVFVSNVLEVENVDNSTGNIDYDGNVLVRGNVCSNFSVKAKGNIEVKGVVEGAFLESGGSIILNRGMNGMGKGRLKAEENVIAKYLENSKVYAGGYVETESILHSTVQAKTEVNVVSKKGFITGGTVSATSVIRVKTLGTAMGATTIIQVGVDPGVTNHFAELSKESAEAQKNLKVMLPVLEATKKKMDSGVKLNPEQLKNLQNLIVSVKTLKQTVASNTKEMEMLKEVMDSSTQAKVEVTGEVYPGTTITISDVSMVVKDSFKYCRFVKEQGVVKMGPL